MVVRLCHQLLKFSQQSALKQFTTSLGDSELKKYQSELERWSSAVRQDVNLLIAHTVETEGQENSKFRSFMEEVFRLRGFSAENETQI